jgi:hypothetical protein
LKDKKNGYSLFYTENARNFENHKGIRVGFMLPYHCGFITLTDKEENELINYLENFNTHFTARTVLRAIFTTQTQTKKPQYNDKATLSADKSRS